MIAVWMPTCASLLLAPANVGFAGAGGPQVVEPGDRISIELGLLDVGSNHTVSLQFQNGTSDVWKMPHVDVSCPACMTHVSAPTQLRPGELGQLTFDVHAVGDPGPHRWGVSLHGGGAPPLHIDVSGILRGLRVHPARAAFGRRACGDTNGIDIQVSWFGEGVLQSVQVHSRDAQVDAIVQRDRVGDVIGVVVSLGIAATPRIVSASVDVVATIRGPDGSTHVVRHVIPVAGHIVDPSLSVRPAAAFLGSVHAGESTSMRLKVTGMEATRVEARAAMRGLRVSVEHSHVELHYVAGDDVSGLAQGIVEIGWGDPWTTKAQIPVTVYVRKERKE